VSPHRKFWVAMYAAVLVPLLLMGVFVLEGSGGHDGYLCEWASRPTAPGPGTPAAGNAAQCPVRLRL